jgi:integrase
MAVIKRGNRFRVVYRGIDGGQHSAGTYATEREAKDAYKTAIGDVARERRRMSGPTVLYPQRNRGQVTVAAYAAEWLPAYRANHAIGARTEENYSSTLRNHIRPRIGAKPMRSVTHAIVREWFTELENSGMSYFLLASIRTCMSAMFRTAEEAGLVTANPVRGIRLPRKPEPKRSIPTPEEYQRLLAAMPERYKLLTETMWLTGMRWAEVIALRATDIEGQTIHVRRTLVELKRPQRFEVKDCTKNGDVRDVRISAELADKLRAAGDRDTLIFTTRNGRTPLRSSMSYQWKRALTKAGLPASRRHDLRHAHATLLANDPSVPLVVVQHRLGHRDIRTTNGYIHPITDAQDAAVSALNAAMARAS